MKNLEKELDEKTFLNSLIPEYGSEDKLKI